MNQPASEKIEINKEKLKSLKEDLEDIHLYLEEFSAFLPLPVVSLNPLGFVLDVNSAFENLVNTERMEILGGPVARFFSEKEKFAQIQKKVLQRSHIKAQEMTLVAAQKKIPVSAYLSPRKDESGNVIGYFIGLYDVTDFKALQESLEDEVQERTQSLKNSRKALMNILEDVDKARTVAETERDKTLAIINDFPEGLLFFDSAGRVDSANPTVREIFEVTPKELEGKALEDLKTIPSLKPLMEMLGSPIQHLEREELNLEEDVVLEISTIRVERENRTIGILVLLRDITREKTVERLKTEFVSLAAHQLRTPLSAIKWTIRMILDGDVGSITKEQKKMLTKTYRSNERMVHLVNDLLNVTRIEEGRFLHEVASTNLVKLFNKALTPLKSIAKKRNLSLKIDLPSEEEVPKPEIDAEKISLVVQNLTGNALQYTAEGEASVSLKYDKNEKQFKCQISDTGIGIPKKEQKRVFSRFFRAKNAVKKEPGGTGLGLFIAKNIIQAHNGKIDFESKKDKGTTFWFTLPVN